MPDPLTDRQSQILDFITVSIDQRGFPPTLREIGSHFGIRSTNGVNDHLKALEKKGHLRREDLKSRAMRPTAASVSTSTSASNAIPIVRPDNDELYDIPILGRVAAGEPLLAVENVEESVRVDPYFLGGRTKDVFGLKIVGESMIDDGIFNGDTVFVQKTQTANQGQIVVAMIEGEATVKRFFPEGNRIRLQPANSNMEPIYINKKDFRSVDIVGIVVGVYRKM